MNPYMMPMMPFFPGYPGQSLPFPNAPGPQPPGPTPAVTPATIPSTAEPNKAAYIDVMVDITSWLRYLDDSETRSRDDLCFSAYGQVFVRNGFHRISQLTSHYVTPEKLVEWLDIDIGHAILILQYLEHDIDAIKRGTLVIPTVNDDGTLGDDDSSY
jgi:hypothetical protein